MVIVTLVTALSVHSASAQVAALTNTDVIRLVSIGVSDQTVIVVIHEAKTTQFDLSPQAVNNLGVYAVSTAVIAAMRQPSALTLLPINGFVVPQPSSTDVAQTLAGAEIEAAKVTHTWTLSRSTGPSPSNSPTANAPESVPTGTKTEGTATTAATTVKDERWWRTRMGGLRDTLAMDKATCDPLTAKVRALQSTYDSYVFYDNGTAKINSAAGATIETKLVDAKSEQGQCLTKIAHDQTAIDTAIEEARLLSVLPGWLR